MAVTWSELKVFVKARVRYDGAAVEDINDLALNSGFDTRAKLSFYGFVEEAYAIYADRAALTLATNDRTVDLFDSGKSAKAIFAPRYVWVNNVRLEQWAMSDLEILSYGGTISSGTPTRWGIAQDGKITFDVPCSGAFANNFASGFARHTAITAQDQVLEIPDRIIPDILTAYMAAHFQMPVVGSNVGLNRLEMYDKIAYAGLREFKAKQIARFMGGIGVGGAR